MAKIWEFFENMNEIVYVSDIDTYEIIYMNRKALEVYGCDFAEKIIGKPCYKALRGADAPCAVCNNRELQPNYFKEWQYYNYILDKHLHLKDTLVLDEGRRCKVSLAIDESREKQQLNMIHRFQNMEALANEGIRIALKAPTPNQAIEALLEYIGKKLSGERTYIFERNEKGNDDNTYEWTADNIKAEIDNLQDLSAEVCANWYGRFGQSKNVIIKDLEEIKEQDPLQYENLRQQEIHSLVVVPLYDEGRVIGFYGVDNPPRDFLDFAENILQILGHFFVSTLRRRNLMKQLFHMSYHDQLTKLGNRYGMETYLEQIAPGKSIGVVYCDITGLKRENDTNGHEAGDRLILRACDALKSVFGDYGLFRIGGDELLVLCDGIGGDELKDRVKELKKKLPENRVNMAVGAVWQEQGVINIDELLKASEQLMYEDKALFYKNSGRERRKW